MNLGKVLHCLKYVFYMLRQMNVHNDQKVLFLKRCIPVELFGIKWLVLWCGSLAVKSRVLSTILVSTFYDYWIYTLCICVENFSKGAKLAFLLKEACAVVSENRPHHGVQHGREWVTLISSLFCCLYTVKKNCSYNILAFFILKVVDPAKNTSS